MGDLECDAASAFGNGGGSQKTGNQRDVSDRIGAQITSVEKEGNRTAPRANRVELALSSNLEKAENNEVRKTPDQDQGECRDGESLQENAKQAFELELDRKARHTPNLFSQTSSKTSTRFRKIRRRQPNPRDDTG